MPRGYRLPLALAAGAALVAGDAWATTVLPQFDARAFEPGAPVDNAYFPLRPGQRTVLSAKGEEDGEPFTERSELSVLKRRGPTILGVRATVQRDRAFEDGLLVEDTFDYYAQDRAGNVWYLGEDVTNYAYDDDGKLTGTDSASSWRAGVNGARPGYIMPATPAVGFAYFQESAPRDGALDEARIASLGEVVAVEVGIFRDVVKILESTRLEPGALGFKYYAPGIGLIREDEGLDASQRNPTLTFGATKVAPVPLPAGLPLLLGGIVALGLGGWRRRRR
ncbi:MAG TPA: hypothetical protein PLH75_03535 [Amaricoccus sp.]|uniref:hypothetical protein n=1 Tax=Amaricoccus sp. TaxID=1872485 RepID=UPI001D8F3C93|nr:hypothetical protein [Amaricoccus sp.]MCB1374594.1 hypothetical protein [Paracoccaceae bacterium]MCC0066481.1 hypothetical protein [Rhodovulum sp.]MCB1401813.1 hypothetical protein [Paracoccaceae bacterium]HPG21844.1 hypothetical protein [Amaricoccus sp.]HRW16186.1 hypothetical protein [Amaricoccus sp.]